MSTDTQNVQAHRAAAPPRRRTSATRVVAGSILVGLVSALVLVLVVFPGATESVTTGAFLLGFSLGWAALAVLSEGRTDQPQRWARVPAAVLAVTGAALVVLAPQNDTLTWLTWVWAPALLALTAWIFLRSRRALAGAGRWLLTPVLAVLAAASLGAVAQTITTQQSRESYPAPGAMYDVGDHRLHLQCQGQGSPTVVLFNGLGEISDSWAKVAGPVSRSTRVCAYDRAGQAWSDEVDEPQDGIQAAHDLHALLAAAGEEGPFVVVGHSIGGPYAMVYAATYPSDVAGMVLLDSTSPRQLTDIPSYPPQYAAMRRGYAVLSVFARLGAGGLTASGSEFPGEVGDRLRGMTSTPRAARNARDEISTLATVLDQAQALTTIGDAPLVVITASENADGTEGWAFAQDHMAELSSTNVHLTVAATHQGLLSDDGGAQDSVAAIERVLVMKDGN
jgi:pimeloyl-ACP methyl ester carboxylesterase